jgi:signal transduction histidine kinase/ligand-binding sensor domain-containing protein
MPRAFAPVPFFLLLCLGAFLALPSQAFASDPSNLRYYGLGIKDGLVNSSVYCIAQDATGLMWFGTFGGLSRWDGENFRTFRPRAGEASLAASVIFALLADGDSIWIGTDGGGLSRFDTRTEAFATWRASPAEADRLSSDRVLALGRDARGRIWAGTADGIVNVIDPGDGSVLRAAQPEETASHGQAAAIRCLALGPDGRMWAGTEGGGLLEFGTDLHLTVHLHDAGYPGSLASDIVRSLLVDSRGDLWVGLGSGGVDRLEGSAGRSFVHSRADVGAFPNQAVRALAEDGSGAIWVGWADAGLGTIDAATGFVHLPGDSEAAMVRSIYRDRSGLVWAGLKDGGLRAYNLRSSAFTRHEFLEGGVALRGLRGLAERPDGTILAGTDGLGLVAIDPKTGIARRLPDLPGGGDARKVYAVLVARDGTTWCGTDGAGLVAISPGGAARAYRHDSSPDSLSANVVWCLFEDADGSLWIGMEGGGLDRLAPELPGSSGERRFIHYRPDPVSATALRGASMRCIFRDSGGRLWVGTWDGGLSRLESDGTSWTNYGPEAGRPGSLGDASVNAIFEDSARRIWVGTGGSGVELLDEELGTFRRLGEEEGLAGSTVYGILEATVGQLWISTSGGLTRLFVESGEYLTYGAEDGLAGSELAQNSWLLARDGRLWFGGPTGLSSFDPATLPGAFAPPPIVITGIEPHGGKAERDSKGTLVLDWRNAGLSFTIAVTDYVAPARNRYAMRLEGGQQIWTQLGHINSGYLGPLRPGTWVLAATGANGNGVWSPMGTSLTIRVDPPWWAQPWFAVLVALLAAASVLSIIALRLRTLHARNALLVKFSRHIEKAREEERTNAAREVHDSIGQHLAVLNLQAWWVASHPEAAPAERCTRVEEMRASVAEAMAAVKRMATSLRPVALDALTFGETLRWYVRDFGRRTGLEAVAEVSPGLPDFGDEAATALFRVLQEALANVARHAGPCSVRVLLGEDEGFVTLEVIDDGAGIPAGAAAAEDSFGLIGMRERCAALGGAIRFEGGPGAGTRLVARVPRRRLAGPAAEGGGGAGKGIGRSTRKPEGWPFLRPGGKAGPGKPRSGG